MQNLSDVTKRKFLESYDISEYEIETDTGWEDISSIHKTIQYEKWYIKTESGLELICADTHIIFDENYNEIFVKDLKKESKIITKNGVEEISDVQNLHTSNNMYDITVNHNNHRYYTNGILSHNTEAFRCFVIWYVLFHDNKTVAILANKEATTKEILYKIQLSYQAIPQFLQQGVDSFNKTSMFLENNSRIIISGTSTDAARGLTAHILILDEFAFIPNFDEFYASVYPTISAGDETKLIVTTTPSGMNHGYRFWVDAIEGRNGFNPIKVTWDQVPGRDVKWMQDTLKALNNDMEKFNAEFNCEFLGSSGTLIAGWKLKELVHQIPINEKDNLFQYSLPQENHSYVMLCDVSEGKGLDYSAFQVIDVTKMPYEQVCAYKDNTIVPADYAEVIYRIGKTYNNASVLIEINSLGDQVSQILHHSLEYENILRTESAGRLGKRITLVPKKNADNGIRTTTSVKATGCSILKLLIEQNQLIINDYNTIEELSRFSKKRNSYEAESGANDDLVMPLVFFAWLSDQQYFKEYVNIDTLSRIKELDKQKEDMNSALFGYITDGQEDVKIDLQTLYLPDNYEVIEGVIDFDKWMRE